MPVTRPVAGYVDGKQGIVCVACVRALAEWLRGHAGNLALYEKQAGPIAPSRLVNINTPPPPEPAPPPQRKKKSQPKKKPLKLVKGGRR